MLTIGSKAWFLVIGIGLGSLAITLLRPTTTYYSYLGVECPGSIQRTDDCISKAAEKWLLFNGR